jgi:hypothetical protein
MSNFSFTRLFYRLSRSYNECVICYEKLISKPLLCFYHTMYDKSILRVTSYNTFDITKTVLYSKSWIQTIWDAFCQSQGKQIFKRMNYVIKAALYPFNICPLYEIICWDGKRYLTRSDFDVSSRNLSSKRHICLHASINDTYDVTGFVNRYPTSFTIGNNIQVSDIACMLLLDDSITYDDLYKLLDSTSENYFYVVDDETLDVRTFKDNEIIVL